MANKSIDWTPIILLGGIGIGAYMLLKSNVLGKLASGIGQGYGAVTGGLGNMFAGLGGQDYYSSSELDALFKSWAAQQGLHTTNYYENTYLLQPAPDTINPQDDPMSNASSPVKTWAGLETAVNLARGTAFFSHSEDFDSPGNFTKNPVTRTAVEQNNPALARLVFNEQYEAKNQQKETAKISKDLKVNQTPALITEGDVKLMALSPALGVGTVQSKLFGRLITSLQK
jgi:hypothetical protein